VARTHDGQHKGISLAKGPVGLLGLAMIAYGVLSLLFGESGTSSFTTDPVSGNVEGGNFLTLEGNGWTNLLWIGAGALLAFGAPFHWGAKSMAIIVGLVLGAASVISMADGSDVFGIFASNGPTQLAWGAAAAALLLLALLPRVGKKKHHDHVDRDREHVARERVVERPVRQRDAVAHRDHDRDDFERGREYERERLMSETGTAGTTGVHHHDAELDRTHAREDLDHTRVVEGTTGHPDRDARFDRERDREVVAPADGDGPEDHGRNSGFRRL
jgi:hypothetical protein